MSTQSITKEKPVNDPVYRSFVVMQETSKEELALRMDVVSDTDFSLLSRLFPDPGERRLFHFVQPVLVEHKGSGILCVQEVRFLGIRFLLFFSLFGWWSVIRIQTPIRFLFFSGCFRLSRAFLRPFIFQIVVSRHNLYLSDTSA